MFKIIMVLGVLTVAFALAAPKVNASPTSSNTIKKFSRTFETQPVQKSRKNKNNYNAQSLVEEERTASMDKKKKRKVRKTVNHSRSSSSKDKGLND